MKMQWVEVWQLKETPNKIFVCSGCWHECVAIGKDREHLGECPMVKSNCDYVLKVITKP